MKTLADIKNILSNSKSYLRENYSIKNIAIFGSYAREENEPNSDVDILVEFENNIGIKFIDLADEIEDLLKTKVDLVSRNGIKQKYFNLIKSELIYV